MMTSAPGNKIGSLIKNIFKRGFFHLFGANFLVQLVGFSSQLIVAAFLIPAELGAIKVMQTYVLLFCTLAGLGFNASLLKFCSEDRPAAQKVHLYKQSLKITLYAVLIFYIFIFALSLFNAFSNDPLVNKNIALYSLLFIPQTLTALFTSYLQALQKFQSLSRIQTVTKLLNVLFIIALTYFMGLSGYILGVISGFALTAVVYYAEINKLNKGTRAAPLEGALKLQWDYAKFYVPFYLVNQIILMTDVLIMNYAISDKREFGLYSFALTLAAALELISITVQQFSLPYLTEKQSRRDEWISLVNKYSGLYISVTSIILLCSIILFPPAIKFVFAGKYDGSAYYFILLACGWYTSHLTEIKGAAILGTGYIKDFFYSKLLTLPFAIAVTYFSVDYFGVMGGAYSKIIIGILISLITMKYFGMIYKKMINSAK